MVHEHAWLCHLGHHVVLGLLPSHPAPQSLAPTDPFKLALYKDLAPLFLLMATLPINLGLTPSHG